MSMREGPTGGVVPEDWTVHFPPYFATSDQDRANLRQQVALTDQIYMQAGVLTAMEVRASRYGGTSYNIDTVLHEEEEARLIAKRELEHEAALQGFEGQRAALEQGENQAEIEVEADRAVNDVSDWVQIDGLTFEASPHNRMYHWQRSFIPTASAMTLSPWCCWGPRPRQESVEGYLKREDGTLIEGPLLMGFYSSRSANKALQHFCKDDEVHGLIQIHELDLLHLRNTYDRVDGIEYAGHTFPGYNDPIRTPDHPTKSHAVLAREGSKVKLIRFGQQGVKGSPKRKGESEADRKRRESFKARHAKNIKKGKMSAAYWSSVTKW